MQEDTFKHFSCRGVRKQGDSLPSVSIRRAMTRQLLCSFIFYLESSIFLRDCKCVLRSWQWHHINRIRTCGKLLLPRCAKRRFARAPSAFRNWHSLGECGFIKASDEANAHFAVGREVAHWRGFMENSLLAVLRFLLFCCDQRCEV